MYKELFPFCAQYITLEQKQHKNRCVICMYVCVCGSWHEDVLFIYEWLDKLLLNYTFAIY